MRYENLAAHFRKNYFVPLNTLGVDILDRVVHLTQQELNEMKEEWLRSYGDYTIVRSTGYLEGYEKGEDIWPHAASEKRARRHAFESI